MSHDTTPVRPSSEDIVSALTLDLMKTVDRHIMPLHRRGFDEIATMRLLGAALANALVTQTLLLDTVLQGREEEAMMISLVPHLFASKRADLSRTPVTH